MSDKNFTGDKKLPMKSLLAPYERRFIDNNIHRFPLWLEGYHLTLMTILWSIGVVFFGYLASSNIHWLWLSSLMLVLQWFTDSFDGVLGRSRDTGIPKWGFYMDHLLDFVFMSAVIFGYTFLTCGVNRSIVSALIPVFGCFMVNSFLAFGATGEFKITYMATGPTEVRIWFIVINCLLIFFGISFVEKLLVYILAGAILFLCIVVYRTQKYVWQVDMKEKASRTPPG